MRGHPAGGGRSACLFLFFACPNLCPSRSLRGGDSSASCRRNRSFLAREGRTTLAPLQESFPEGSQGSGYAVEFILESRTFLLKLLNQGLN
jgi:hypothetical protein